jgi:hypothetical protein
MSGQVEFSIYWKVKLTHLPPAEPRTTLVSYWDDWGQSGMKLLLRSHLPRQHYGNSQLTTQDGLQTIKADDRWSYSSRRCFHGRSRITPAEPWLTQAEPRSIQAVSAPAKPRTIPAEPRQSPGQSRQSPGRTPVDWKCAKMIMVI